MLSNSISLVSKNLVVQNVPVMVGCGSFMCEHVKTEYNFDEEKQSNSID